MLIHVHPRDYDNYNNIGYISPSNCPVATATGYPTETYKDVHSLWGFQSRQCWLFNYCLLPKAKDVFWPALSSSVG